MSGSENVDEFFDPADGLGNVAASFSHAGGTSSTVNGNFVAKGVGVYGVETLDPRFDCAVDSLGTVDHGDIITIEGVTYVVREINPDGTGEVSLKLQAAT